MFLVRTRVEEAGEIDVTERSRRPAGRAIFTGLLWLAGLAAAGAESVELPAELAVDTNALVLELWNAQVDVLFDGEPAPLLRASATGTDGESIEVLELSEESGTLTIRRPPGVDDKGPPWKVEVVLNPAQRLRLAGRDVVSSIEDPRPQPGERSDSNRLKGGGERRTGDDAGPRSIAELSLAHSQADIQGLRSVTVQATESSLWLTRTSGPLELDLEGGSVESIGHRGPAELTSIDAGVILGGLRGGVTAELEGGSLEIQDGAGAVTVSMTDALLVAEGRTGQIEVEGEAAVIEARASRGNAPVQIEGADLQVILDQIRGRVAVTLEGGSLEATALSARLELSGEQGAVFELSDLAGHVELELAGASEARFSGAVRLEAEVTESTLWLEQVQQAALAGVSAEIHASGIQHLAELEVSDSELELDLTDVVNNLSFQLSGASRGWVGLPTPCIVQHAAPEASLDSGVEVTGCDLRNSGQPIGSARSHLIYGARRPVTLTLAVDEEVELEIEGRP
ncbi:MAG: hypothetical protein GY719_08355 [bacterium]|nr:hypothetical protein [bacterium]